MTSTTLLLTTYIWEPSVWLGAGALLAAYAWSLRFRLAPVSVWFVAAVALMVWSLVGPLDILGDGYLFSAHMLQHLILLLLVAPGLLLGLPQRALVGLLTPSWAGRIERVLGRPVVAWSLHTGTIWVWHLPALYEAALRNEGIHVVQHLTFLITAVIFWWPLVAPTGPLRLSPLSALGYLFAAALSSTVLGIILTFAPTVLYPTYVYPRDPLHILGLLRGSWGLSAAFDQQLGGLLMWVPGSMVYLVAMMGALLRWYGAPAGPVRVQAMKREGASDAT